MINPSTHDELINEPDAQRLIFGLRDTGYNVKTAAEVKINKLLSSRYNLFSFIILFLVPPFLYVSLHESE
jgi:hypothetical protein